MKKLVLVPLLGLLAPSVSGCKKSDSADGASAAASAESPQGGALAALSALKGFEGEITVAVKSEKERKPTPPITVTVKGARIRFDVPEGVDSGSSRFGEKAHMIVDAPSKRLLAVVDDKKQVVVIGLDMMSEQMKSFAAHMPGQAPHAEEAPSKVEKTGKTDTVAGYKCEEWNVTSAKGERAQICVASEDASWFELPTLNLPTEHAWAKELLDGHHFPLRLVSYDAAGGEKDRIEVTKLEKKSIADSVFAPPAGYQVVDMGAMMRSMMGAPGMMPGMPGAMHPGMPGAMPAGAPGSPPPGMPPGMQLPPGVQLPNNMQMPANAAEMMKQMQERARAAGVQIPQQPPPPAH